MCSGSNVVPTISRTSTVNLVSGSKIRYSFAEFIKMLKEDENYKNNLSCHVHLRVPECFDINCVLSMAFPAPLCKSGSTHAQGGCRNF